MSLVEGLAQLAAQLGHGVYRRDTPYLDSDIAIVLSGTIPKPDRLLVITTYTSPEPDSRLPFDEPYVQWRIRGTPDEADSRQRADALYDDLHGLGPVTLPNELLVLSVIALQAGPIPLGRDDNGRHEHTLNTRIEYHRPSSNRPAL